MTQANEILHTFDKLQTQGRINLYANYAMAWGPPHQGAPRGGRRKKPYTHLYFAIT